MKLSRLISEGGSLEKAHKDQFALDVLLGLAASPKSLSPKYLYDSEGSRLFQKITSHKEYYLTKTEFEILDSIKNKIPEIVGEKEIDIVELGAGDGHKSKLIVEGFLAAGVKVNYCPIDISSMAMKQLETNFQQTDMLSIHGVVAEYMQGVKFLRDASKNKQLVLFLGSNIGNFSAPQSETFLRNLWKNLGKDDLLLAGFDLKKDISKLTAAYNDSSSHTKNFNLNLLTRINRELGADFDVSKFYHHGVYNPVKSAMESYLISTCKQKVYIKELQSYFDFDAFEALHLEYSFKFSESAISGLCSNAGFSMVQNFSDSNNYFIDSLWRVIKQ